ncbi:MAG: M48 family metallopeptidase [Bacteroidetes bacterium]|nr:M48 family metallopeptidase [Bacteroidota bacterium]
MKKPDYTIQPKEHLYFSLMILFGLIGYALMYFGITAALSSPDFATFLPILIYIPLIVIFLFFRLGILVGFLKGNSIKVTGKQFADINRIVLKQCKELNIKNIPDTYILQNGGLLNAFATRFLGHNYIVLYSDVLDEAYKNSYESIEFIIGHELGHIKRNHMLKSLILFPSFFVPFLYRAYSRACEYTCDNI